MLEFGLIVSAFLLAVVVTVFLAMRPTWVSVPPGRTVIVHTTEGRSLRGIVRASNRYAVELAHVVLIETETESPQLDGRVVIQRDQVELIQVGMGEN